ncbi:MAG: hypothetical protein K9N23_19520 [Akkermansiaceae bacterium]|nr:hypothetical protein [Akkermansiaceae bacterium]MCF7733886.1 hypothetical protein [Akkermansiaceae bacterium]
MPRPRLTHPRSALCGAVIFRFAVLLSILSAPPADAHGDLHGKIEEISRRIEHASTPDLRFQRANLYFNHGEAALALEDLAWLDQYAPGKIETDPLRAVALHLDGRDQAALSALDRYLKIHPDATRCLALRARVRRKLGNTGEAMVDYQAAIALDPQPAPDLILEAAEALVAENRSAEAVKSLDAAITRLGPVPALALRALEIEIAAEDWDGALARTASLQASAPRPEPWMCRRGEILERAGRIAAAHKAWQELLNHLSNLPPAERDSAAMTRTAVDARHHLTAEPIPPTAE